MRRGWGTFAIALGAWEAIAVTSKRLPTVTATVARCHSYHPGLTRVLLAAWMVGLWRHLIEGSDGCGT